jgi:hypothetical protein
MPTKSGGLKIKLTPFIDRKDEAMPTLKPALKDSGRLQTGNKSAVRQSLLRATRRKFTNYAKTSTRKPRVTFVNSLYPTQPQDGQVVEQHKIEAVDDWYEDTGILGVLTMLSLIIYPCCFIATALAINFQKMTPVIWIIISHTFLVTLFADIYSNWFAWKIMFRATTSSGYVQKMRKEGKLPVKPKARRRTNDLRQSQIQSLNPTDQQRRDRASVGIVHASHYHISFIDFLYYHVFFFRIDWIYNTYTSRMRHLLIKYLTKLGWKTAYRWYTYYTPLYEKSVRHQIAALLLESSLMLGLSEVDEDSEIATFKFTNWYVPSDVGVSQILMVKIMVLVVDLQERELIYAEVNGEEWTDMKEVLQITIMCHSIYYHVLIHLYSNWWFIEDSSNPLHVYGLYSLLTNSISIYFGHFFDTKESGRWMFMKNAIRGIHFHYSADLERFSKYSRTARFLLKGRKIAKKYCTPENMKSTKVGFESFFIASILHNVDHHMAAKCSNPLLSEHKGPHKIIGASWIRSMLDHPHREILVKTSFKNSEIPWIRMMHKELSLVDEEYADMCHIGIRF